MSISKKALLEAGAKIYGLCGIATDIYPQLIGKHICFGSQDDVFNFKYIIRVDSIEEKDHSLTLYGKFYIKEGFMSDHSIGKKVITTVWVIDNYIPELQ